MAEWDDPELMSSHIQTNTTTTYRTTHSEKHLKTSINGSSKIKENFEKYIKMERSGRDVMYQYTYHQCRDPQMGRDITNSKVLRSKRFEPRVGHLSLWYQYCRTRLP